MRVMRSSKYDDDGAKRQILADLDLNIYSNTWGVWRGSIARRFLSVTNGGWKEEGYSQTHTHTFQWH